MSAKNKISSTIIILVNSPKHKASFGIYLVGHV